MGQSVLMDQKSPKWEVLLPGESPRMAPCRAMEGGCGSWDGAQTSRRQRWQNAERWLGEGCVHWPQGYHGVCA